MIVLLLLFQYAGRDLERRLGVLPTVQHFTELYFLHPAELPSTVMSGHSVRFSFVIENLEGRSFIYHWSVVAETGARKIPVETNSAHITDGQSRIVNVSLPPQRLHKVTTLEVRLTDPVQAIDIHLHSA